MYIFLILYLFYSSILPLIPTFTFTFFNLHRRSRCSQIISILNALFAFVSKVNTALSIERKRKLEENRKNYDGNDDGDEDHADDDMIEIPNYIKLIFVWVSLKSEAIDNELAFMRQVLLPAFQQHKLADQSFLQCVKMSTSSVSLDETDKVNGK